MKIVGCLILMLVSFVLGVVVTEKKEIPIRVKMQDGAVKMMEFYNLLIQWIGIKQRQKSIVNFFENNGYHSIAIYGMKELGKCLYDELQGSDIEVKYIIDNNITENDMKLPMYKSNENLPYVDAIVVTAIHYFGEIEYQLSSNVDYQIVNLEDIIYEF